MLNDVRFPILSHSMKRLIQLRFHDKTKGNNDINRNILSDRSSTSRNIFSIIQYIKYNCLQIVIFFYSFLRSSLHLRYTPFILI